jgi:hypothetical protein
MLLTPLDKDLRAGVHSAMLSWLPTPRTGLAIRKTTRSMKRFPDTSNPSWLANANAAVVFRPLLKTNSDRICNVACWNLDFYGSGATPVTKNGFFRFPASRAPYVPRVAGGGWPGPPRTWSIA